MVTIEAVAAYGHNGQYVAKITGRAKKFTFAREFVGRKNGKRNEATTHKTDEVELFEVVSIDKKGRKEIEFYVTLPNEAGELCKWFVTDEEALTAAKRMDDGEKLTAIFELSPSENTGKLAAFLTEVKKPEPVVTEPKKAGRPRKAAAVATIEAPAAELPAATQIVSVEGESSVTFAAGYLPGLAPDAQGKLFAD